MTKRQKFIEDQANMIDHSYFTFDVGPGNYSSQITNLLKARGNWREVYELQAFQEGNFYWRQCNLTVHDYIQFNTRLRLNPVKPIFFNHFEKNSDICKKTGLIKTLGNYYNQLDAAVANKYTVFETTPTTFVIE